MLMTVDLGVAWDRIDIMADLPCRDPEVTVLILQQRPEVVREVASVAGLSDVVVVVVVKVVAEEGLAVVSFSGEPVVRSGRL